MNIKKTISLSFLLFANISILVHIVLFHHHDSQLSAAICAENIEHRCAANNCPDNDKASNCPDNKSATNCPDTDNANDCPDNKRAHKCCTIENCILKDFITKADGFKLSKPFFDKIDFIVNINPACHTLQITDLTGLPFRQKPDLPFFYDEFISQSLGLRAPPAC